MTDIDASALNIDDLRRTVAEVLDVDESELTDEARFIEDLGCDSLLAMEVVLVLEKKYSVKLREAEFQEVTCLPKAYSLLASKLADR